MAQSEAGGGGGDTTASDAGTVPPDVADEFSDLLAQAAADVFGRTIDELTGGGGGGTSQGGGPTGAQVWTGTGVGGGGTAATGGGQTRLDAGVDMSLHIPPKMIAGVQYEGMLFINEPRAIDVRVAIAIDGRTRMSMPATVVIRAGDNHAVFPIRADEVHDHAVLGSDQTTVTVHAIPPIGQRATSDTTVYLASFKPSALHIAAPTGGASADTVRTATGHVPIRIIIVDSAGVPVDAEADTIVHLTSSSNTVRFSTGLAEDAADMDVVVRAGDSSAEAIVSAGGDATVYAGAAGLQSDSIRIDHDDRDIEVHMGVAPDPAVQTTVGYYYVWLEKDDSVYIPDGTLDVRMSSSDPSRVRFTSDIGPGGEIHYGLMEEGIMRGKFFAVHHGTATLSASVEGYGSAVSEIEVAPTIHDEAVLVSNIFERDGRRYNEMTWHKMDTPDTLKLWVFPDKPAKRAWGVVGTYTTPFEPPSLEHSDAIVQSISPLRSESSTDESEGNENATESSSTSSDNQAPSSTSASVSASAGSGEFRTSSNRYVSGECTSGTCPVHADGILVTITSDGDLEHPPAVDVGGAFPLGPYSPLHPFHTLDQTSIRTSKTPDHIDRGDELHLGMRFPASAAEFAIEAVTVTDHSITVSADGMESDTASFDSRTVYGFEGSTMVTPIPSRMDDPSDIAFVSITDSPGSGYIVNLGATHRPQDARVIQTGSAIHGLEIGGKWIGGTTVLSGTYTDERAEVFVQVPGLNSRPLPMSVPGRHTGVEAWLPPRANVGESFPVAIHTVNNAGVPIRSVRDSGAMGIVSGDVVITEDGAGGSLRMTARGHGTVQFNVLSDGVFSTTRPIETFVNPHESDVDVGTPTPDVIHLGDSIVLDVSTGSIDSPRVSIDGTGDLRFMPDPRQAGRYVATPDEPGLYSIGIRVSGEGWDTYDDTRTFSVEEFVTASYTAIADDGVSVPSALIITALTVPSDGTLQVPNGGAVSVHPGIFEVAIDTSITIGGDRIYGLTGLRSNGEDVVVSERFTLPIQADTIVQAMYQRDVDIDFAPIFDSEDPDVQVAVTGSGSYRYGESVILEAVPAPELYGLVWHMPETWEGLPDDAVVSPDRMFAKFEALETSVGHVEFRRDYSIMTLLVVIGAAACGFIVWRKAPADTVYNIQDGLISVGGKLASVAERPKSSKAGRAGDGKKGGGGGGKKGDGDGDGDGDGGEGGDGEGNGEEGENGENGEEGKTEGADKGNKDKKKKRFGGGLRTLIKGGDVE